MAVLNAQLTGSLDNRGNVRGGCGHLSAHLFDRSRQLVKLSLRSVNGFAHTGEGGFKVHGCLNGGSGQTKDRGGDGCGQGFPDLGSALTDLLRFLREIFQRFPGCCPGGLRGFQLLVCLLNGSFSLFDSGLSLVQLCLRGGDSVRGVLGGALQGIILTCKLLNLSGSLRVLLLGRLHVLLGSDRRRVGFTQGAFVVLILSGGLFNLTGQLRLLLLGSCEPVGIVLLAGIALSEL